MIFKDDLRQACQAVGLLATEIDRRMRAGERQETATRHALALLEIKTRRQKPRLQMVEANSNSDECL